MSKTSFDEFWDYIDIHNNSVLPEDAMQIGTIVSENPLRIQIDDLVLGENKLKINPYLKEWTENVNVKTTTNNEHNHEIINIIHPSKLKLNNQVACYGYEFNNYSKSYQRYMVLEVIY